MSESVLPASPNWYSSRVADANSRGIFVFGARRDIVIFDINCYPPIFKGTFRLHRDKVGGIALGSNEKDSLCCSGSEDGKVKIWDVETKDQLFDHSSHRGKITAITWFASLPHLVVSGDDVGDIVIWQHSDGRTQTFSPENTAVMSMDSSPCNAYTLAVGYKSGVILVLDVRKELQILQRLRGHDEDVHCVVWCPIPGEDYRFTGLGSAGDMEEVIVPGENIFAITDGGYGDKTVDFGDEGHLLASGSKDKTIRIWSTSKGRQVELFRLPKASGNTSRDQGSEYGQNKLWTTLVWKKSSPLKLISSSFGGEILQWDITSPGQQKYEPFCVTNKKLAHYRMVFNLCVGGKGENTMCSISMDRQIILWNLKTRQAIGSLPTLGGFVYVIKSSPVDAGRLAAGVGDNMIRIWNLNSSNPLHMKTLWQGIKGKVTALSWHPVREGLLGFGTDDGRVGIYDTLTTRSPSVSSTYHKKTVYVVAWGPSSQGTGEDEDKVTFSLYSIGDGIILEHMHHRLNDEAISINDVILRVKGEKTKLPIRSEISWNPDFSLVAVGNDDGSVEIFQSTTFSHIATVHVHKKLVNCIQWHPHFTVASPGGSSYKHYLATGSNEAGVGIVDLASVFGGVACQSQKSDSPVTVNEVLKCLLGHVDRITGVVWSPHIDNQLATVSYDGQAIVWDVDSGQMLACYQGHQGKLLCVHWSGLEAEVIFTGADDFTLHKWNTKLHPPSAENAGRQRKYKLKGKKQRKNQSSLGNKDNDAAGGDSLSVTLTNEDKAEIEKLMEEKRKILMEKSDDLSSDKPHTSAEAITETQSKEDNVLKNISPEAEVVRAVKDEASKETEGNQKDRKSDVGLDRFKADGTKDKKKKAWKGKSLFPLTGRAENRGKEFLLDDLLYLTKQAYGDSSSRRQNLQTGGRSRETSSAFFCPDSLVKLGHTNDDGKQKEIEESEDDDEEFLHLGFFLDRRAMYRCLRQEGKYHRDHDNMDYYYQLEIWKGNINGVLRLAREREELSDWLVSMAPMATYDTWVTVCEDYATQLEAEGQYHKAATYLLAAHKVYDAIELFRRHRLFKEAIALAKVRLSPFDPVLEDLYTLWAQQLTRDGNYEQAAKCHLAMKQVQDAALLLARRYNQSSLKTASHICLVASEKQQGLMYAHKVVTQYMLQSEWKEAYNFLNEQKSLQCLTAVCAMHELLMKVLNKTSIDQIVIDSTKFTVWEESNVKPVLPDFILDSNENDLISPWQPELIEGHTFPHHVLRILHSNLGIKMDTSNLEEMYKALSVLHAGRQVQTELPQLSVQVSMDLVLCLLSLLMSETPTAISHLLQATSLLHEAGHKQVMECVLKLFLPQGPKYMLKLQQEVTAMRVVISMENQSHLDGASKVHTIKRYLTDLKEDQSVSHSSLRCRELDCLRAYYYLAILNFLRNSLIKSENTDHNTTDLAAGADITMETVRCNVSASSQENRMIVTGEEQTVCDIPNDANNSVVAISDNVETTASSLRKISLSSPNTPLPALPVVETEEAQPRVESCKEDKTIDVCQGSPEVLQETTENTTELLDASSDKATDSQQKKDPLSFFFDVEHSPTYQLTMPVLCHLGRGLLWDMQGKRYALTETLGYIHKAISQLLLAQRPSSSLPPAPADSSGVTALSPALPSERASVSSSSEASVASGGHINNQMSASFSVERSFSVDENTVEQRVQGQQNSQKKRHNSEPVIQSPGESPVCPFHRLTGSTLFSRSLSSDNANNLEIGMPFPENLNMADIDIDPTAESGVCASCEWLTKSRRVLWEDEPHLHNNTDIEHGHNSKGKLTSIVNPAKYINVPDEWYNMAADQKYSMPYVTMAILKEEQEYMMHELKRGPDALQMPFPSPLDSVKLLLEVGGRSAFLNPADKQTFTERVVTWGMKFSVSSQQKEALLELLHKTLTHE